jgi:hypothetical protein
LTQVGIEPESARCGVHGARVRLIGIHRAVLRELDMGDAEMRPGKRERGVTGDRLVEIADGTADRLGRVLDEALTTAEKELVRLDVAGRVAREPRLLVDGKLRLERGRDVQCDIALDGEDVSELAIVRLRPELPK